MFPLTTLQLAELLRVHPLAGPDVPPVLTGCRMDSRLIQSGDAFFAFRGQHQHGIDHAVSALAAGAVCVVTDQSPAPADSTSNLLQRTLTVADTAVAMQQIARWNRGQSSAALIGITGSVGKTSTRQMIAAVLQSRLQGIQSPGNYNNELGVPLTLTELSESHQFAAVEMGAGRRGDIRFLCELARPAVAVVTRVAPCHLMTFGSLDQIARTKAELPASLPADGLAFLNADDPRVQAMSAETSAQVVYFGERAEGPGRITAVASANGRCRFRCGTDEYSFFGGRQLVLSAAAAISVGREWGLQPTDIQRGLDTFRPGSGRGQVSVGNLWTLIDETYNSSPASLAASIEGLAGWEGPRRVLVAGDMLELGSEEAALHSQTAALLAGSAVDLAIFVGSQAERCRSAAAAAGFPESRLRAFSEMTTLSSVLPRLLEPGDVVLMKGSRALQLERVLSELQQQNEPDESFHGELHRDTGRDH